MPRTSLKTLIAKIRLDFDTQAPAVVSSPGSPEWEEEVWTKDLCEGLQELNKKRKED